MLRPMASAVLDTLEIAKRLKGAGFSEAQAETMTGVLRDARDADWSQLATKDDLARLEAKLDAEAACLEAKFDAEAARLEAKFDAVIASVRAEMEILRRDLTIRLGSMIVVATGVLLAAKFFG